MARSGFKMKSAAHGGPMRKNFPSAFRAEEEDVVQGGMLPEVKVTDKKLKVKNVISVDPDTGKEIYTKSKGSRSSEYVKNPDFEKKGGNRGRKRWIRRDGAKDPSGMPTGFN